MKVRLVIDELEGLQAEGHPPPWDYAEVVARMKDVLGITAKKARQTIEEAIDMKILESGVLLRGEKKPWVVLRPRQKPKLPGIVNTLVMLQKRFGSADPTEEEICSAIKETFGHCPDKALSWLVSEGWLQITIRNAGKQAVRQGYILSEKARALFD